MNPVPHKPLFPGPEARRFTAMRYMFKPKYSFADVPWCVGAGALTSQGHALLGFVVGMLGMTAANAIARRMGWLE